MDLSPIWALWHKILFSTRIKRFPFDFVFCSETVFSLKRKKKHHNWVFRTRQQNIAKGSFFDEFHSAF